MTNKIYVKLLLLLFSLLFLNNHVSGEFSITEVTTIKYKNSNQRYGDANGKCSFFNLIQMDDPDILSLSNFNLYLTNGVSIISKNAISATSTLFQVIIDYPINIIKGFDITGTNGLTDLTIKLNVSCNALTAGEIKIVSKSEMSPIVFGRIASTFKMDGIKYFFQPDITSTTCTPYNLGGTGIFLNIQNMYYPTPVPNFTIDYIINPTNIVTVQVDNYYYKNIEFNEITNFKLHPNNQQDVTLLSNNFAPVFTFESNSSLYRPYFSNKVDGSVITQSLFRLISTNGSIKTYIGFYDYTNNVGVPSTYSLYAQENQDFNVKYSNTLNVAKAYQIDLNQNVGTISITKTRIVQVGFTNSNGYQFTRMNFNFNNIKYSNTYPYGFQQGTMKGGYTYSTAFLIPDNAESPSDFNVYPLSTNYDSGFKSTISSPNVTDSTLAVFTNVEFIHLHDFMYILRINATFKYPIYKFTIQPSGQTFNARSLASADSTLNNVVYEIVLDLFYGCSLVYVNDNPLNYVYQIPLLLPSFNQDNGFNFYDIKSATILYKTVNVTNQDASNVFYFNYSNIDINTPMGLITNDQIAFSDLNAFIPQNDLEIADKMWPVTWNSSIEMFQVEFWIPRNSAPGKIPFALVFDYSTWVPSNAMGPNAEFEVISLNADLIGPVFTLIEKFPSNPVSITTSTSIGWKLTIDDASGFRNGSIRVIGSVDGSYKKFQLAENGNNVYTINIQANTPCISQDYIIADVTLYDIENNLSKFTITYSDNNGLGQSLFNPFINYLNDSNINRISVVCTGSLDPIQPTFSAMEVGSAIVSNSYEYPITITLDQSGTGSKYDHYPTIYATAIGFDVIECQTTQLSVVTQPWLSWKFSGTCKLPVAFGYPQGFLISVYGMVNNGGYFVGSSYGESTGYITTFKNGFIQTRYDIDTPYITGTSKIADSGTQLWVYGKGFKLVVTALYSVNSKDFYPASIIKSVGYNALLLDVPPSTSKTLYIKLLASNNINSTVFLLTRSKKIDAQFIPDFSSYSSEFSSSSSAVSSSSSEISSSSLSSSSNNKIPIPTNAPQKCLGTPECGGSKQGYCSTSGCICLSPWIGKDCSSQVIIVPQPTTNTTDPSTGITIPTIDEIVYKSFISLVSIRELDINDNIIFSKTFDIWIFTQINNSTFQYECNITKSIFNNIGQNETVYTPLIATLEWFKYETNITFANQQLIMNPSTLKYTINIGEFKFSSTLNKLELIMSASFESSNNDACSSNEFGETSNNDNSNYLKLSIQDHSMYARFLKRGIVDKRITSIQNRVLDSTYKQSDTQSSTNSFIGILVPHFESSVIIDPDFSILLNHDNVDSNSGSICKSKNGLSSGAIAGIVIGSFAFLSVTVISTVYYFIKKSKDAKFKKAMNLKMLNK